MKKKDPAKKLKNVENNPALKPPTSALTVTPSTYGKSSDSAPSTLWRANRQIVKTTTSSRAKKYFPIVLNLKAAANTFLIAKKMLAFIFNETSHTNDAIYHKLLNYGMT
jgi:hypothetical protein